MALSQYLRGLLDVAIANRSAAKELADAVDLSTAAAATSGTVSGAKTFTGGVTITTAGLTITDVDIALGTTTGTKIGTATTQKLAFYNSTPIVQRSGSAQAAVVGTGATNSSPYGYSQSQADAIVTLINEIRTTLVNLGLMKGSA